jgi:hypothetical protein
MEAKTMCVVVCMYINHVQSLDNTNGRMVSSYCDLYKRYYVTTV